MKLIHARAWLIQMSFDYPLRKRAVSIKEQEIRHQADALIVSVKESYLNGTGIHEIEKSLF